MTAKVKAQILQVRDTGETNMLNIGFVQWIANRDGLYDLVVFLLDEKGRQEYSSFIFTGEAEISEE